MGINEKTGEVFSVADENAPVTSYAVSKTVEKVRARRTSPRSSRPPTTWAGAKWSQKISNLFLLMKSSPPRR